MHLPKHKEAGLRELKVAFKTLYRIADRQKYPKVFKELMPLFLNVYENDITSMSNKEIAEEMKEMHEAYMIVVESMRIRSLTDSLLD